MKPQVKKQGNDNEIIVKLLCEQRLDLGILRRDVMWSSMLKGHECEVWGGEKRSHTCISLHVFLQLALITTQEGRYCLQASTQATI